jgi:hypothetical protein
MTIKCNGCRKKIECADHNFNYTLMRYVLCEKCFWKKDKRTFAVRAIRLIPMGGEKQPLENSVADVHFSSAA